jgi:hypothetical protein
MVTSMISTEIEGVVAKVNPNGFLLQGRDSWTNLSRFADPRPAVPQIGDRVRVGLDKSSYARCVQVITPSATPVYSGGYNAVAGAQNAMASTEPPRSDSAGRDLRIVRMNAITNATAIVSSGGQVADIGDVIAYAATLEAWVTR